MTREHYDALLKELDGQLLEMGESVAQTIAQCVDTLESLDVDSAQQLIEADNQIDQKRYDIENQALVLIATQQPLAGDLRVVAAILTIATELERIGDYCEGIAELTLRMAAEPVAITGTDVRSMALITQTLLRQSLEAYRDRNVEMAGEVWTEDDNVDDLYEQVFRSMIAGMIADRSTIRSRTYLLWVAHNIERMADRVTNIAERVAFVVTGDVATFRDRLRSQTVPG
ncbi:MAG TPA: phosphate transport system regulatory protein PhoU [Chloroflexi bacterium]|jgi:phosphate transport system protein|nr:phosphate transport system regulatory protein PhoU [Chloroflexota bacterium]